MKIEQIYTGCLAQGAYFISHNGEAIVIDPLRETKPYLARAEKVGAKIKYIFETHFHADFVSGHLDLAQQTGAKIIYGPTANPNFEAHICTDGEVFEVGELKIKALHTPGHTLESTCYLLFDPEGNEHALFTGDTLFIGDVGRPDLAQPDTGLTSQDLAAMLFDSLRTKIMTLPDEITVYPAHGAGSACGKSMSKETFDSLGHQKAVNYALRADMTKEEFVFELTDGLARPPAYFPENVRLNREGYQSFKQVLSNGVNPLSPDAFELLANESQALLLDTRDPQVFSEQFVPNSINIGLDGQFAPWVGALIPTLDQPILLITDLGREEETVTRLARVGFDNCLGYLDGSMAAWVKSGRETDQIERITAQQLSEIIAQEPDRPVLDVRRMGEYETSHIPTSIFATLDDINVNPPTLDKRRKTYIHCAGGYRSMIYASILRARGHTHIADVIGGYKAIEASGLFASINEGGLGCAS
jgi:hydroxyacylglutathione hydrolase